MLQNSANQIAVDKIDFTQKDLEPKVVMGEPSMSPKKSVIKSIIRRFLARFVDTVIYYLVFFVLGLTLIPVSSSTFWKQQSSTYISYQQSLISDGLSDLSFEAINQASTCTYENSKTRQLCEDSKNYQTLISILINSSMLVYSVLYFVILPVCFQQFTLGKKIFRLKTVSQNSQKPTLLQYFTREFFWIILSVTNILLIGNQEFAFVYLLIWFLIIGDLLRLFFNSQNLCWHDKLAKTKVVDFE